ncbi:MAG: antiholin-like murein hydrolase modulator LrgA [Enterococcus italicus]|jgi:holin-like protein|uniref:Antiholin-like protein LrgA n=1 Tax=Enterococcus italicus (strain DSM 15952 / CCUG 50447 / LMG 22039 / TP 1.5) TaxID=888064 RepID=E6LDX2_ENTI1|nr:antiholin-like murein hydrolase modulator LrgA [Enterococcus italicus]EFU74566.1 antiholin-like protein LrgA [Enterococcus italicus DSM 15952]MCM6881552.1 antiholin-like murein hydrolase modulator LrgA [Enterococcus italicus]OJG58557.1 murein hydrolase regulator LrgA [Enterococcus italicus DSM 15952]HCS30390.1 murein hydrolase transporter LrgA [Enterococcus sp.]
MKKTYSIMYQSVVIGAIILISKVIELLVPFTMPSSVIGLVLLFVALCLKIVKLEQVEKVGDALVDNIGLFFVPAGISVINSFELLKANFVLDILLIFISTVLLLLGTGWVTQLLLKFNPKKAATKEPATPNLLANQTIKEVH